MSVSVKYKFKIKHPNPIDLKKELVNKNFINFNYIKSMTPEEKKKITYHEWAKSTFGYDFNSYIQSVEIDNDNSLNITIFGNKNGFKLEPWFEKFKENCEIFIYSSPDYKQIDPLDNFIHIYYENNQIITTNNKEDIGKELTLLFISNDEYKIKNYLVTKFQMPQEFCNKPIREIVSIFAAIFPSLFEYLPSEYISDKNFLLETIDKNCIIYNFIKNKLYLCDRDIILSTLTAKNKYMYEKSEYYTPDMYEVIKENFEKDKEIVLNFIKKNKYYFKDFAKLYNDDKDVVMSSIGKDYRAGDNYYYFSKRLKEDNDVAKEYVKYNLYKNDEFQENFNDNKEIALYALNNSTETHENILYHLSERLKDDEEIVKKSIEQNPESIVSASVRLKNDYNLCMSLIKQAPEALEYIGDNLLNDYNFCKEYITYLEQNPKPQENYHNGWRESLQYMTNEKIIYDTNFVMKAIKNGATLWSPRDIFERYLDNEEIMVEALLYDNYLYRHLPEKYRDNEVYTIAALTNPNSIEDLETIEDTRKLINQILESSGTFKELITPVNSYFSIYDSGNNLAFASDRLKDKKEIVLYAISQTKEAIKYASQRLKKEILNQHPPKGKIKPVITINFKN